MDFDETVVDEPTAMAWFIHHQDWYVRILFYIVPAMKAKLREHTKAYFEQCRVAEVRPTELEYALFVGKAAAR